MKLFRGTRAFICHEYVEVYANNYYEAIEKIEDDDSDVKILSDDDGVYEVQSKLEEIIE